MCSNFSARPVPPLYHQVMRGSGDCDRRQQAAATVLFMPLINALVWTDEKRSSSTKMADTAVTLRVYDISKGYAKQLSTSMAPLLGGKVFDGVWHTSVVVFGREWQYSANWSRRLRRTSEGKI